MKAKEMIEKLYCIADTASTLELEFENVTPEDDPCEVAEMARAYLSFIANAMRDTLNGKSVI